MLTYYFTFANPWYHISATFQPFSSIKITFILCVVTGAFVLFVWIGLWVGMCAAKCLCS